MISGLLVTLVTLIYFQTAHFAFVNFDDNVFVYANSHVLHGLTWENAAWSLTAGVGREATDADYWRPLSILSHMLDVSMFGLNAGAHHMVSVAMHTLVSLALFLVMRAMTGAMWRSAFVAAVFAVHPLHVESVAWVAERKDVLSGLFFVLTMGAYTRFVRRPFGAGNYFLVLVTAAMGLASKPMLVTLPFVLLLLDHWPLNRTGVVCAKRLIGEKVPLFIMSVVVVLLTLSYPGSAKDAAWAELPWFYRSGNACMSYVTYILQSVWPVDLACFYPHPRENLVGVHAALAVLALMLITLATLRSKKRFLQVGWLWYLGMLVPVVGFAQAGQQAHADRYTYLSMIGLGIMIVWWAADWADGKKARRMALGAAAALAIGLLTIVAHRQTSYWRDSVSLWTRAVESTENNAVGYANLGAGLVTIGRLNEAVSCFRQALAIQADYKMARLNLGLGLLHLGQCSEAAVHLRRAHIDDPQSADASSGLALALVRMGDLSQAIPYFVKAVEIRGDADNCFNLGNALLQNEQTEKAVEYLVRATVANPTHIEAQFVLGTAYAKLGKQHEAVGQYRTTLATDPGHLASLYNLSWLLATSRDASIRDGAEAVVLMERALQRQGGNDALLLRCLAAAHAESGDFEKAAEIAATSATLAGRQGNSPLAAQASLERQSYVSRLPWRD